MISTEAIEALVGATMSLVLRPQRVRVLIDDPVFTQRILDRFTSILNVEERDGSTIVDIATLGYIPLANLAGAYFVRIGYGESLVAKVEAVDSGDGACRLYLGSWCAFINHDPTRPPLGHGIHLWLGAAWALVPLARAA